MIVFTMLGLAAVAMTTGCSSGLFGPSDAAIAELAASASAYDVSRSLDTASDSGVDLEQSVAGAVETAVRSVDDLDRALRLVEDLGDGRERITITWTSWNGVSMKRIAERMKAPAAADARWASGDIVDAEAMEKLYAGDLANPISTAELTITWSKDGSTVFVSSVLREGERLRANGDFVNSTVEWDAGHRVVSRRVEYLRVGQTVAARTIVYTYTYGSGDDPTEIRMDVEGGEGYALILSVVDPRIVEWYRDLDGDGDDEKAMRLEKVRNAGTGTVDITRTVYAADGSVSGTSTVNARIVVEDGQVLVTRTTSSGATYRVTVTETADGYLIQRGSAEYSVVIAEDGSMTISTAGGVWYVTQAGDGSWEVVEG
jgi:hypothetical protein